MKMDRETLEDNLYRYGPEFNEIEFIKKLGPLTQLVSLRELVQKSLQLWFLWQEDVLSLAERSVIVGALGYVIVVADLLPDTLLGGYCDDLLIVNYALQLLEARLTPAVQEKAAVFASKWLPK